MRPVEYLGDRLTAMRRSRLAGRFSRYLANSVLATAISQATFLTVYGLGLAGPRVATVTAFLAAAVPAYLLNRGWAWSQRGRPDFFRETLPYLAVILTNLFVASTTTSWVDAHVEQLTRDRAMQVALVTLTFTATYGLLFIGKFLIFEHVLFSDRRKRREPVPPRR